MGRGVGCVFKRTIPSLLPGSWGHPWGFRREGGCCGGCDHISATAKASGACNSPSRSMALQESEKGNQNLSIGKASREPRFQACRFLPSLISHQVFPCIMHFFGASKLYFHVISMLIEQSAPQKVSGRWNVLLCTSSSQEGCLVQICFVLADFPPVPKHGSAARTVVSRQAACHRPAGEAW